jgi:tetratricopeptide (TPR) repeat protein
MRSGRTLPATLLILFIFLGLGLLVWNLAAPESLARTYGRFFGKPLEIYSLEMNYGRQVVTLAVGEEFELNPSIPIQFTELRTNRWRNYDLRLYSPAFDLQAVTTGASSLLDMLGEDYFSEPKDLPIEVLDGSDLKGGFTLKGVFTATDWSLRGDAAVELEKKIGYYRKALDLEPDSKNIFDKLSQTLLSADRKDELAELLELKLAKEPQGPEADNLLNSLLTLYRDLEDKGKEISVLERLLPLAKAADQPLEGLKTTLASLYRDSQPLKAAAIYEELINEVTPDDHKLAYLNALVTIYRREGMVASEIATWEKLLELVGPHEKSAVWTELLTLREKTKDEPGQRAAWAGLAESLPNGLEKANAYKRLGYLWYKVGDLDQAGEVYQKALGHDQTDSALYLNLARLALEKNDHSSYLENLKKAWELKKEPTLTRELALAYTGDGLKDKAVQLWLVLAEKPGDDPETVKGKIEARARILDLLRPEDGSLSEEFEKRLYEFSDHEVEFYNLGVAHYKAKNWDSALKAFQKAQELDSDNVLLNDIRGYYIALYKQKGQIKEMLDQAMLLYKSDPKYKESRDLVFAHLEADKKWKNLAEAAGFWTSWHPDDPDNWRFLALGQKNSGQEAQAAKSLLKVAELEPKKVVGWFTAAEALAKSGDKESAKKAYEKVLELEPTNDKAESALLKLALDSLPNNQNKN